MVDVNGSNGKDALQSHGSAEEERLYLSRKTFNHTNTVPHELEGEDPLQNIIVSWLTNKKDKGKQVLRNYTWKEWLFYFVPCFSWLSRYERGWLPWDLLAGISVAAMVVPQGMSYAKGIAGLPSQYGLYGAFVPVLVYAVFGTSRQLAVGPVAVTSLLLSSGIKNFIDVPINSNPDKPTDKAGQMEYNMVAVQIAFFAGIFYTAIGIFQLGFLSNLLSHSVIGGFMTGASLIISCNQIKYFLGIKSPQGNNVIEIFENMSEAFEDGGQHVNYRDVLMGLSWLVILFGFKFLARWPKTKKYLWILGALGPLTVTAFSILLGNVVPNLKTQINMVGKVPSGLPDVTVSWWFNSTFHKYAGNIIGLAALITVVDLMESYSIATAMALLHKYELVPNQEIRGLGYANLAGAIFNCYTTTGSFSRTAVNNDVGAKTGLAGGTTGILVMFTLLFLMPVFRYMPNNAQGAIVVSGVLGLFQWRECIFLWGVNKFDFLVFMAGFLATALAGVEIGIGVSVGLALLVVIFKSAFPHVAVLGQLPKTNVYRSVKQYPQAETFDGILMMRVDAPVYFANVHPIRKSLRVAERRYIEDAGASQASPLQYIILDLSPVTDIDATAVHWLNDIIPQYADQGVRLAICNPSKAVILALERARLRDKLGENWIFVDMHQAVRACQDHMADQRRAKDQNI